MEPENYHPRFSWISIWPIVVALVILVSIRKEMNQTAISRTQTVTPILGINTNYVKEIFPSQ